jgi:hypothetical protein
MNAELIKLIADIGLGGLSFALFLRLGKVVANHEIRITKLEDHRDPRTGRKRRRRA